MILRIHFNSLLHSLSIQQI